MRVKIVRNYKNLATEISNLIDILGHSKDSIAQKIGLSAADFATKRKRNNFSGDEAKKIVRLLGKQNVESYLMIKRMEARKDEPTVSPAEFKTQMGWK